MYLSISPISTHTPLAGRDWSSVVTVILFLNFYSHAPCGARHRRLKANIQGDIFLLTRPLRGATYVFLYLNARKVISTHTPLAGRDRGRAIKLPRMNISTHTPLAGRDMDKTIINYLSRNFYSHAPCGARHVQEWVMQSLKAFLLTRPLRGATRHSIYAVTPSSNFYSHAPCGALRVLPKYSQIPSAFLLTRPLRGATRLLTR